MGCFTRAEMIYIAALKEMFSVSFLEFGVLLLVHRLNPDVGVVGEYVKLKLLGLLCLVKGDACEHIVHAVVVGEVGERTHELVFTSLVYY